MKKLNKNSLNTNKDIINYKVIVMLSLIFRKSLNNNNKNKFQRSL